MYTQCPNCLQKQSITVEQLRNNRAIAFCSRCSIRFDALERISDGEIDGEVVTVFPWQQTQRTKPPYRLLLAFLGFLVLMQVSYFQGHAIVQYPLFRHRLEKICGYLHCRLPSYKNLSELATQGALTALPDGRYLFKALVNNRAQFAQAYPNITLTLLDYQGNPFSQRIFRPEEYLPTTSGTAMIEPNTSTVIELKITDIEQNVGGYTFALID